MNNKTGVYKITCLDNGRFYIGQALNIEDRWKRHLRSLKREKHCNIHLQRVYDKYGKDSLKFEILALCPSQLLDPIENGYLKLYVGTENCMNIARDAKNSWKGRKHTEETCAKMREAAKGKKLSEEHKAAISKAGKGRVFSDETRAKLSLANTGKQPWLGKKHSEETKKKMSISNSDRRYSEEQKEKMKGRVFSEEHKKNMSEAAKKRWSNTNG